MIGACTIWGLSPLYYKMLSHVPPLEVLAHRTLWSLVFFGLVLAVQGRLRTLAGAIGTPRRLGVVLAAALAISTNWFLFIRSIATGHAVQASLGYYIFPLAAVLIGVVLFGERLGRWQALAVGLAALAVAWLAWGLGAPPWISLALAASFAAYGAIKRFAQAGPVVSVTAEVLLLSPLALGWLGHLALKGTAQADPAAGDLWLLVVSGPLTGAPLILFSYAARRVRLATLGLLQYLNPTLQFLVATLIFREAFSTDHAVAFGLIWLALAVYSADSRSRARAARSASTVAAASGTTDR